MRTVRKTVVILAAVAGLLAIAAPAFAHEEINPKQFPTGTPTFFTLSAANEKKVDLNKITLTAPQGTDFGSSTRSPAGWTVNRTDSVITWTGGAVKPDAFEQWGYEIEGADQPGTLTYKVTLGFTDGSSDDVNVQTTAIAAGTTATTVAGGGGGAVTTAPASGTTTATTEAKSGSGSAARTRANIALVLGAVALVAAIIALVLAGRKRDGSDASAPAAAGGGQKQDW
jgi:uncharacterized protein YcnI